MADPKFDTLADDYDRCRPRYPAALVHRIVDLMPSEAPYVVDAGAGTGIVLEALAPLLDRHARYAGVDISEGMVAKGRDKFPQVDWTVGEVEPFLESAEDVDLVVVAQAFQWMDRPRFLRATRAALRPGGVVAIIQNNRDFRAGAFLAEYESLLEDLVPDYSRDYRAFDFARELGETFGSETVDTVTQDWSMSVLADEFVDMAKSSTQVQRGIAAHGDVLLERLERLIDRHAQQGAVDVPYHSELFTARVSDASADA